MYQLRQGVWFLAASVVGAGPVAGQAQPDPSADPAVRDPSVQRVLEERLSRPGGIGTVLPASTGGWAPVSPTSIGPNEQIGALGTWAELPGAGSRLPEGTFLVRRRGQPARASDGQWVFVFHRDTTGHVDPPMILLPSPMLERLESLVGPAEPSPVVYISGQVFQYHGQNLLLPSAVAPYEANDEGSGTKRRRDAEIGGENDEQAGMKKETQRQRDEDDMPSDSRTSSLRLSISPSPPASPTSTPSPESSGDVGAPAPDAPTHADAAAEQTGDTTGEHADEPEPGNAPLSADQIIGLLESEPTRRALAPSHEPIATPRESESGSGPDGGDGWLETFEDRPPKFLVHRRARLIRGPTGRWLIAFDNDLDTGDQIDRPIPVAPCGVLQRAEGRVLRSGDALALEVSGRVVSYRTRWLFIPTTLTPVRSQDVVPNQ